MMGAEADCVFCSIVAGRIPTHVVLDAEDAIAFLDIAPIAPGHTLLIPKRHYVRITDATSHEVSRVTAHLPKLVSAVLSVTGATACNVLQNNGRDAGQAVDHMHFHIIPRRGDDGLGYRWRSGSQDSEQAEQLSCRIAEVMGTASGEPGA